jgi:hypothetical protein
MLKVIYDCQEGRSGCPLFHNLKQKACKSKISHGFCQCSEIYGNVLMDGFSCDDFDSS